MMLGYKVLDGNSASFWFDRWIPFGVLMDFLGEAGPSILGIPLHATVSEVCNESGWILPSSRLRNPNIKELRTYLLSVTPLMFHVARISSLGD